MLFFFLVQKESLSIGHFTLNLLFSFLSKRVSSTKDNLSDETASCHYHEISKLS